MITLMTLNLNGYGTGHGGWEVRRDLTARAISDAAPDAVVLQAVRRDPAIASGLDQAHQLASALPALRYVAFIEAARGADGGSDGLAVLSARPFSTPQTTRLSRRRGHDDVQDRIIIRLTLDAPSGPLEVINAHFSWVEQQTADNVEEALRAIGSIAGPAVLLGDLNADPDGPPMRRLAQAGWVDLWRRLRPAERGATFEQPEPSLRIDYAWATEAASRQARAIETVPGPVGPDGARISDHVGLLVRFDSPAPAG